MINQKKKENMTIKTKWKVGKCYYYFFDRKYICRIHPTSIILSVVCVYQDISSCHAIGSTHVRLFLGAAALIARVDIPFCIVGSFGTGFGNTYAEGNYH